MGLCLLKLESIMNNTKSIIGKKKLVQVIMILKVTKAQENTYPPNKKMPLLTNFHNCLEIAKMRDIKKMQRIEVGVEVAALEKTN